MFRRAPRRHRRSFPLSFQPLESRLAMAGDFPPAVEGDAFSIKADDVKWAEVTSFSQGPSIAPNADLAKAPLLDEAGKHHSQLNDLLDRMEDVVAVKEAEQAGLGRDVERESRLIDPATGDAVTIGQGKATAFDSGLGGRAGVDPYGKGKASSVTDPLTGQPLLGGVGSGWAGPSENDAMAAGMAGKSRAMDDSNPPIGKKRDSNVVGTITFQEAHDLGEASFKTDDGTQISIFPGHDEYGDRIVAVLVERPDGTGTILWYGEVPDKPRPDDDGGTPPRQLTDAEKQAVLRALRGSAGPAGKPRPDDDGAGGGTTGGVGEILTDLDLAGQPRPDDDGTRGGVALHGPVFTGLGLAGQPVDDDTNFGVVIVGGGGLQPPGPRFGDARR